MSAARRAWLARAPQLAALLLAACVTPSAPSAGVQTRANPGLESPPTRGTAEPVGWFELPQGLGQDPRAIAPGPLDVTVQRPEELTLPNGLKLLLREDHSAPLVTLTALVEAGGFDEPKDKLGLSDLVADLCVVGGAGQLSADQVDQTLDFHGANASASAQDEYTVVSLSLRSQDLAELFGLFADMVRRPRFDQARFEVQVARVLESVRRRPDRPDGLAARALRKAVFGPDTPLGREPTAATLKALTVADLVAFHRAHFVPRATRVLVSGDFERAQLDALVKRLLADWAGPVPPARPKLTPERLTRRVILVPKQTAQAKVRIGAPGFTRKSEAEYPARLANTALGAFGVGRLYLDIRDEKGLAYSAYTSVSPGPTNGLFMAGFDTKPELAHQAIAEGLKVLEEAREARPLTEAELKEALDSAVNAFAFRFDSSAKIVFERALYELYGYPDDYLERFRQRLAGVDLARARGEARELLDPSRFQIVVVGPPEKLGDLSVFGPVTRIDDVETFAPAK